MRNNRMAQQLRELSLKPGLESDTASTTETGPAGDGTVKTDLAPAEDVQADGAGAPGEDQTVTPTVVEVGERSDLESAETVATDADTKPSAESVDEHQAVTTTVMPEDQSPTHSAGVPGEDTTLSTTTVGVGERSDVETAETVVTDSPVAIISAESDQEAGDSSAVTNDGDNKVAATAKPIDETPADGAGAPGEDQEVTAKVVDVGERSDLESAETTAEDSAGNDLTVSTEGIKGAITGFLLGAGANVVGSGVGAVGGPGGMIASRTIASSALDAALKQKREQLKQQIHTLAKTLADLKNGDIEAAKKKGLKIKEEDQSPVDKVAIIKSILLGNVVPFYTTYQGHKVEELEIELAAKLTELKLAFAHNGVAMESAETQCSSVTNDGEDKVSAPAKPIDETPADGAGAPGEDQTVTPTVVEVGERSDLENAETNAEDSAGDLTVSTESLTLAALGFIGISAAFSAWFASKYRDTLDEVEELTRKVEAKRKAVKAADLEFKERAEAVIAKAKAEGKVGQTKPNVSQESSFAAAGGAIYAGLLTYIWGPLIGPLLSMGIWGASWAAAVKALTKLHKELEELETKLADRQLDLATRVSEAEKKYKVSQEGLDDDGGVAAQGAMTAAAAFAEGAAAAAEVVAGVIESAEGPEDEGTTADLIADAEMTDLEEGIAEGEASAEKYEHAAATMESLIEALKESRQTGGLTPQSARFFQIGFESVGVTLTGAPFKNQHGESAIPSLESYGGTMRRDKATDISMEAAEGWLKKIMDVLRRTYAQVKEWLTKFLKAVLDKSERTRKRAEKIKTAASKLGNAKPKNDKVNIGASAGKIAVGTKVESSSINDVMQFAKEAGTRNGEASIAIVRVQRALKEAVANVAKGGKVSLNDVSSTATTGKLRSAVFNIPYEGELGQGFKTEVLPGNVEFATLDTTEGAGSRSPLNVFVACWKVAEIRDETDVDSNVNTLTPYHITEIADAVLRTLDAIKAAEAALEQEAVAVADITLPEDVSDEEANNIRLLAWSVGKMVQTQSSSIGKALRYASGVCDAYLDYATASLKQYEVLGA